MSEPNERDEQACPLCGRRVPASARYPGYLCQDCASKAVDSAGRALRFGNVSMSGGFVASYDDGSPAPDVTRDKIVYVDGIRCHADEARFGGIVVIPTD